MQNNELSLQRKETENSTMYFSPSNSSEGNFSKSINTLFKMPTAIILTEQELEEKIDQRVQKLLVGFQQPTKTIRKTNLDINEGIDFLNSIGFKCSKSLIQKKTMLNEMPCTKFGRRISFNADDLTKWVETQKTKSVDIAGAVSRSANSRLERV